MTDRQRLIGGLVMDKGGRIKGVTKVKKIR